MGQINDTENSFRIAIINGLNKCGVKYSHSKLYKNLNYGLIIKPLNLDYNFRDPIRYYFKGYPYHVGIIKDDIVYSFCPDLREPHRGTLQKDIIIEHVNDWHNCEIFWFVNNIKEMTYLKIGARLIDLMHVKYGKLELSEFNRRHNTNLKMLYSLLSNNCTDVALTVLIGQTRCFQIESIIPIIISISKMQHIINMLPEYGKMWLADFKYLQTAQ